MATREEVIAELKRKGYQGAIPGESAIPPIGQIGQQTQNQPQGQQNPQTIADLIGKISPMLKNTLVGGMQGMISDTSKNNPLDLQYKAAQINALNNKQNNFTPTYDESGNINGYTQAPTGKIVNPPSNMTPTGQAVGESDIKTKLAKTVLDLTNSGKQVPKEILDQLGMTDQSGQPALSGDAYLEDLKKSNPDRANVLKGIGQYQFNLKDAMGRGGYGTRQSLISDIMKTNPDFDEKTYEARQGYQNDLSSGGVSKNITALNTAVGHLDSLKQSLEALGNGNIVPLNNVKNFLTSTMGGGKPSAAIANLNAVENEMANVFKQSGATDPEIASWKQAFSAAASPDQQKAVISKTIELMNSRLGALTGQYQQVMGQEPPPDRFIYPQNQQIIQKYQNGGQPNQSSVQPNQSSVQPNQSSVSPEGTIVSNGQQQLIKKGGQWVPMQ